eukprot:1844446-Alexandrium_andersonii.AAC.1
MALEVGGSRWVLLDVLDLYLMLGGSSGFARRSTGIQRAFSNISAAFTFAKSVGASADSLG